MEVFSSYVEEFFVRVKEFSQFSSHEKKIWGENVVQPTVSCLYLLYVFVIQIRIGRPDKNIIGVEKISFVLNVEKKDHVEIHRLIKENSMDVKVM